MWLGEIREILKDEFKKYDYKFPCIPAGRRLVALASLFD